MTRFNLEQNKEALRQGQDSLMAMWHELVNAGTLTVEADERICRAIDSIDLILRHRPDTNGIIWLTEAEAVDAISYMA